MHMMAKGAVILVLAVFLAVAAAAVVSTPERESGHNVPKADADRILEKDLMDAEKDKSAMSDIVSSIGTQVASATDQVFLMTGNLFNSAIGGISSFVQSIQNFLSGKPIVATTTEEDGSGSVVFLAHSKPKV